MKPGNAPEDAPAGIYGPNGEPRFFADPGMDRFVAVVMNLAQEVWRQEERLMALEGRDGDRAAAAKTFVERVFAPVRERAVQRDSSTSS